MPRALSLEQLLNFEAHWDTALKAVLESIGLPLAVHIGGASEKMESPYVAGFFTFLGEAPTGGGTMPQVRGGAGATKWDPVSFRGRFNLFLNIDRKAATAAQIEAWRGGIRRRFLPSEIGSAFNGVVLPFYDLRSITIAAGERLIDEERDLDQTGFVFEFDWAVRDDAWPH